MAAFCFLPEAEADLNALWEHVAEDNVAAADRLVEEIHEAVLQLVAFPHSGHRRDDLTARPLLFLTVRDRLIAYSPTSRPLLTVAIIHGVRDPKTASDILHARREEPST